MSRHYAYKFTIILEPEEDGGYSVHCPALPGCSSQGDTLEEALANIKEAILSVLKVRHEMGMPVVKETSEVVTEEIRRVLADRAEDGLPLTIETREIELPAEVAISKGKQQNGPRNITGQEKAIGFSEGTAHILSVHLLKLAEQALRRAKRREIAASKRNTKTYLDDVLEVYVLVAASLEAFINEFCSEEIRSAKSSGGKAYWLRGLEEITDQKMEVRLKWQLVPQLLWQKAFDYSKPPWQDFHELIQLRNRLLHYKMEFLPSGKMPKFLGRIQHLVSPNSQCTDEPRSLLDVLSEESEIKTWVDRICNIDMAEWAFNTGMRMIDQFLALADTRTREDYEWLLKSRRIRRIGTDFFYVTDYSP